MTQTLSMFRGDDRTITVTVVDANGAVDLTTATLRFTAKRALGDYDSDAIITKTTGSGISHGANPALGVATVTIGKADTEDEDVDDLDRDLWWDIQLTTAAGLVRTIATGRLQIISDVSVTTP